MRGRILTRVVLSTAALGVSSCIVTFDDYPVDTSDASSGGSSGAGGGLDSSWAGTSGSSGKAGGGGVDASAGSGGSATGGVAGSAGGAGGVAGIAGTAGNAGSAGAIDASCIPLMCKSTPLCGDMIENGCGGHIACACAGTKGCVQGVCDAVVTTACGSCPSGFTSEYPSSIIAPTCSVCTAPAKVKVCVKPGWENAITIVINGGCSSSQHSATTVTDCAGDLHRICVAD